MRSGASIPSRPMQVSSTRLARVIRPMKLSFLASQVSIGTVRKVGYFLTTSDEPGSFGGGGMP